MVGGSAAAATAGAAAPGAWPDPLHPSPSCASTRRVIARRGTPPTTSPAKSIGNRQALAKGSVAVTAYGVLGATTFGAALAPRHTPDPPQSGRWVPDQAAPGRCAQRGGAALGLALPRRLGRSSLRRQRPLHQRVTPPGLAVGGGHPLASRRLDAAGPAHPAHPAHPLAALRARLHRWDQPRALHSRDHLRHAPDRALRADHHRPVRPCRQRPPGIS